MSILLNTKQHKIKIMTFSFPYATLEKIRGNPTFQQLDHIREKLCANAGSVPSQRGGGLNGHTGMMLAPLDYATISNTPWTQPLFPGTTPILVGLMARQCDERKLQHAAELLEWNTYNKLNNELQKLIIATFDDSCLEGMKLPFTVYNSRSAFQLLEYLFTTWGTTAPLEGIESMTEINKPIDPTEPLTHLWCRIDDTKKICRAAAAPLTESQVMNIIITLLTQTAKYKDELREWNKACMPKKHI